MDSGNVQMLLASILGHIEKFDRQCKRAEYTDTDQVWELLYAIRGQAQDALKELRRKK